MVNFRTPQEVLLILGSNKLDVYLSYHQKTIHTQPKENPCQEKKTGRTCSFNLVGLSKINIYTRNSCNRNEALFEIIPALTFVSVHKNRSSLKLLHLLREIGSHIWMLQELLGESIL